MKLLIHFKVNIKQNNQEDTKTLSQQSAILNDSGIIDFSDLSLNFLPSNFKKFDDPENEKFKRQIIHETYPSVIKQWMNNLFFAPSFFTYTSFFIDFFSPPDNPLNIETKLKYQKRYPDLKIGHWKFPSCCKIISFNFWAIFVGKLPNISKSKYRGKNFTDNS